MRTFRVYIGSDATKPMETHKYDVSAIADKHLFAYTLIEGQGTWEGTKENTCIVEVIANEDVSPLRKHVLDFAQDARDQLNQACVLVTAHDCETILI